MDDPLLRVALDPYHPDAVAAAARMDPVVVDDEKSWPEAKQSAFGTGWSGAFGMEAFLLLVVVAVVVKGIVDGWDSPVMCRQHSYRCSSSSTVTEALYGAVALVVFAGVAMLWGWSRQRQLPTRYVAVGSGGIIACRAKRVCLRWDEIWQVGMAITLSPTGQENSYIPASTRMVVMLTDLGRQRHGKAYVSIDVRHSHCGRDMPPPVRVLDEALWRFGGGRYVFPKRLLGSRLAAMRHGSPLYGPWEP